MAKELKLVGNYRFNWALTIFYFSYIAIEIPSNILLKKVGGRYVEKSSLRGCAN